jgi:hypothetical protein
MHNDGRIIILPHPGDERRVPFKAHPIDEGVLCDWPPKRSGGRKTPHRRKFLRLTGQWRNHRGRMREGLLNIWTEYEAPTRAVKGEDPYRKEPGRPKYVHTIITDLTDLGSPTLNTDPWIFYPGFVWSTCLHNKVDGSREEPLREGDIVLFGSSKRGDWLLDTVLVIDRRDDCVKKIPRRKFGPTYDALVRNMVKGTDRPFIGKRFQNIHTPFSFVPCKPEGNGHTSFARPSMKPLFKKLLKKGNGSAPSPRNARGLAFTTAKDMATFWTELLRLIDSQGLVMGTFFRHPGVRINLVRDSRKRGCGQSRPKC